jgi:hypothetical protein
MDIATIEPGLDFREAIERGVQKCDVFLPVIGQRWLNIEDHKGRRRLDLSTDPVRMETQSALEREGLRVVPILVQGAKMPSEEDLPEALGALAYRSAQELSDTRWQFDVQQLVRILERIREQLREARAGAGHAAESDSEDEAPGVHSEGWSWSDYEKHSPHAEAKMRIVRAFVESIVAQTQWEAQLWKNQIGFRSQQEIPLRVQFWGQEVRLALITQKGRPDPDPLAHLRGNRDKYGNWIWRLTSVSQIPDDLQPLIDVLTDASAPASQESARADQSLQERMLDAYAYLSRRHGYNATHFLRLVKERGAHGAAETLLRSRDRYSDGFLKLVELGELEHSVEALVLRPQYRHMFEEQELAEARRRLKAADFDADSWEEQPWD